MLLLCCAVLSVTPPMFASADQSNDADIAAKSQLLDRMGEDNWEKLRMLEVEQRTQTIRFCLAVANDVSRQRCIKYVVRDSGMLPMSRGNR